MQTFETVEKEDGRWWIRCKSCKHGKGILQPKPESVEVVPGGDPNQLNLSVEAKMVCAWCGGEVELHRVEVTGTIEGKK